MRTSWRLCQDLQLVEVGLFNCASIEIAAPDQRCSYWILSGWINMDHNRSWVDPFDATVELVVV